MTEIGLAEAQRIGAKYSGTVVAIGKFEGVHRGHQQIIDKLMLAAKNGGHGAVVLTFANNPLSVLNPAQCPPALMSPGQRVQALSMRGADEILMLNFTKELSKLSAYEFIKTYLVDALHAKHVIVGQDFRFGSGAQGDPQYLAHVGAELGFSVEIIAEVKVPELGRVSSTLIRQALSEGDVKLAAELLGHPHAVRGTVVTGDRRGRELGVPTANLGPSKSAEPVEGMVPADGVYAGAATVAGKQYAAAISVGNNPTFTPNEQSRVEAYLLDFAGDIYGEDIEISFYERLRETTSFDSVDALIAQMQADIAKTRELMLGS